MIIVLPPSETKTRPAHGPAPGPDAMSFPQLGQARETMLKAAVRTAGSRDGASALGIPAGKAELVERMRNLREEPTAPPLEVYSGVLYDALGDAKPTAPGRLLVTSALLGVVDTATDRIPAYRVSAGSRLSRLGTAGSWWRKHLAPIGERLAARGEPVIDCRSGSYRSMMPIPGAIEVSAVRETEGRRATVSHDAKRYRGLLAGRLLRAEHSPGSIDEVAEAAREELPDPLAVEVDSGSIVVVDRS